MSVSKSARKLNMFDQNLMFTYWWLYWCFVGYISKLWWEIHTVGAFSFYLRRSSKNAVDVEGIAQVWDTSKTVHSYTIKDNVAFHLQTICFIERMLFLNVLIKCASYWNFFLLYFLQVQVLNLRHKNQ